jgi:long-chain acyl-CoA synthetase
MTHEHYCMTAMALCSYMPELLADPNNTVLLFLPQAHTFARAINYIVAASDMHIYIARGISTLITDLQVAKPSIMIVVPRVLEKVYNAASQKAGTGLKGMAFASAVVAAQNYMKELSAKGKASTGLKMRRAAFDPTVYRPLRDVLGGRSKWIVAGGAPLDPQLLAFFRGANVPAYEGYGLTETTAPCAFNPARHALSTRARSASPSPASRCASRATARFRCVARASSSATTRTTRPPKPPSPPTDGMPPAIWAT